MNRLIRLTGIGIVLLLVTRPLVASSQDARFRIASINPLANLGIGASSIPVIKEFTLK